MVEHRTASEQRLPLHSPSMSINYLNLDADKVLSAFGKYGKYQMLTYITTNSVHILFAINMMVMPFVAEVPAFDCQIQTPPDTHWEYTKIDACHIQDTNNWTLGCLQIPGAFYNYSDKTSSLAAEFDLVCDNSDAVEHGSSIFMLGGLISQPIITQLSDVFGRRISFLVPLYIAIFANLICAFAPTYTIFLLFRFISGFATSGFTAISWVLCMESVALEFRSYLPLMSNITWVIGYLLAGVFRLFISDWRWLYFAISIPGILTIPFYWFVPESLHWMITRNKNDGIKEYIDKSSKFNKRQISLHECKSDADLEARNMPSTPSETASTASRPRRTAIDIFVNGALLVHLLINSYILIVLNGTYWALSLFSTDLSDDKWTGFFLSGLVELPAGLLSIALLVNFKRKTVSAISLSLQSMCMIGAIYAPVPDWAKIIFPLMAKGFNTIAWSVQPLLYSEGSPTSLRNVFSGTAEFIGDIGSVLAPYLKRLEAISPNAPFFLIAGMSFFAAISVLVLPETKGKKLPEDIEDVDVGPVLRAFGMGKKNENSRNTEEKAAMVETTHEENSSV